MGQQSLPPQVLGFRVHNTFPFYPNNQGVGMCM